MADRTSNPVRQSVDIQRIMALPRRVYNETEALALAERLTPWFLNARGLEAWNRLLQLPPDVREAELAKGTKTPLRCLPEQAFMINDFALVGGLYASAPLGVGKTLTLYLTILVAVERFGVKRPLVACPGDLVDDMVSRFQAYEQYYRPIPVPVMFESFERVWGVDSTHLLCRCEKCIPKARVDRTLGLRPDGLFMDEADRTRRGGNIARKRLGRYLSKHPVPCVFVTATPTGNGTINDFGWHAVCSLKMGAPVPISSETRKEWAEALDTKVRGRRRPLGALGQVVGMPPREANLTDLKELYTDEDSNWQEECAEEIEERRLLVLRWFAKRWRETPGFCVFTRASCSTPLIIRPIPAPPDEAINRAFAPFRKFNETPTGDTITDSFSKLTLSGQLGAGLCHQLVPPPEPEYRDARRAAGEFVRDVIRKSSQGRNPIDSEANVYRRYPTEPVLVTWQEKKNAIKRTSIPNPIALSVVHAAASWLKMNHPALVFTFNTWVGETIARLAGVQYFSNKGRAPGGMRIEQLSGKNSAVLSAHSNRRGRDLYEWNRCLYVGTEITGSYLEQLLGRPHRNGQLKPVYIDIMILSAETLVALERSIVGVGGANEHIETPSKLLAATWDWSYVNPSLTSWESHATKEELRAWNVDDVPPPDTSPGWRWCQSDFDVRDLIHRTTGNQLTR